jgi:hypothetical protein
MYKTEIERRREGGTGVMLEQREGDGSEEGRKHTGNILEGERRGGAANTPRRVPQQLLQGLKEGAGGK